MQELTGTIDRFLFNNEENGYAVFIVALKHNQSITVKGHVPSLQAGQNVTLTGDWVVHPKFGKQFEAKQCTAHVPTSIVGLKKYLGSGMIKGIGPVYAEKLVSAFGEKVLEVIDQEPQRLGHVPGIGPKRVEQIIKGWQEQKDVSKVMIFLQDKGVSTAYAAKIYKKYGKESIALVTENPYRLAEDIWGIGFKTADQIAGKLGISTDSIKRIKAGILFAINQTLGNGHLYSELNSLKEETIKLLELAQIDHEPLLKNALHDLYNENKIKLISHQETHYLTLTPYYYAEKGIAHKLLKSQEVPTLFSFDIDAIYNKLRVAQPHDRVVLNEDQQRGVIACLQHKVTVITGGPGTGKTTLIKKLLSVLDENKKSYRLAAPTGRAAKRITEGTGRHAVTIHRLLEFDFTGHGYQRNEQNALKLDFLIIDEASMIDTFLMHAILKAVPYHAHVIFIGDVDQLPSVGPGNVLSDMIASEKIACVRLQIIFRQAQDSMIIVNAHRVNRGEFPTSGLPDAKKDFIYIKELEPEKVQNHLAWIYSKILPQHRIKTENSMVLVPMNRGIVGTFQLNHVLQGQLNTNQESKQLTHGIYTYKVGDRVMQMRNNYDKDVFNGDVGFIKDINIADRVVHVLFEELEVSYESSELDELVLAYAISIHKSQGSEYDAAIIPLFMQHFTLLQRNLLYTAITRAKRLCILIGQPKAIGMAIGNVKGTKRRTFLSQFLTSDLSCR